MGCGMIAHYGHLPALVNTEGLQLVAVYDPVAHNVEEAQKNFGVPHAFTDVDAFFDHDLDAVVVTSPAPCHSDNVHRAAARGLHVLCEKPLAMTDDEAEGMIQAMERADRMLFTAFCYRFSPVSMQIREMVERGTVGDVRSLRLVYIWNCHGRYSWNGNGERVPNDRRAGRMFEGGPIVDCGVHQIDLARWWLNSPVARWQAAGAWVEEFDAPDHMYLHMDHENGAHTMVEISYSYCHTASEPINHFSYHLIGTDGLIRYDRDGWHFEVRGSEGTHYLPGNDEKNFGGMYHAFSEALERGEPGDLLPSGRDGLDAIRIARDATDAVIAARLPPLGRYAPMPL